MKTRAELEAAIAAIEELPNRNKAGYLELLASYRAQLAALGPEPEQPWTERERRLREALKESDAALCRHHEYGYVERQYKGGLGHHCEICSGTPNIFQRNSAALTEAPPPDPRDEALEVAGKALKGAFGIVWAHCVTSERVGDAEKSARHRRLMSQVHDALAAIARARGGK